MLDLIHETANVRYGQGLAAYDEQLNPLWAPTFADPRGDRPDKIDSLDRITLRHALMAGLRDTVHFGCHVVGWDRLPGDRVAVRFADGRMTEGDVLVAADGAGSRIAASCQPAAVPADLGIRTIFGRIPIGPGLRICGQLRDRFSYVLGSDGNHIGLMPMIFRHRPDRAAARLLPGLTMPGSTDYYMCVFNVHTELLGIDDQVLFALPGRELWNTVLGRTAGWHPDLRSVLEQADTSMSFAVAMRLTSPVPAWEPGPVVPLGDAAHTMPPAGGVGANTAVRDARGLTRALTAVSNGERTRDEAITEYQADMVRYATEAAEMSMRIVEWSIPGLNTAGR